MPWQRFASTKEVQEDTFTGKVMVIDFLDINCVMHSKFMPAGITLSYMLKYQKDGKHVFL